MDHDKTIRMCGFEWPINAKKKSCKPAEAIRIVPQVIRDSYVKISEKS